MEFGTERAQAHAAGIPLHCTIFMSLRTRPAITVEAVIFSLRTPRKVN